MLISHFEFLMARYALKYYKQREYRGDLEPVFFAHKLKHRLTVERNRFQYVSDTEKIDLWNKTLVTVDEEGLPVELEYDEELNS